MNQVSRTPTLILVVAAAIAAAAQSKADVVWSDIGPGVQAGPLTRTPPVDEDVTLSSNGKDFYLHLADIVREGKAPDYPRTPVVRSTWPGFPRGTRWPTQGIPQFHGGHGSMSWGRGHGGSYSAPHGGTSHSYGGGGGFGTTPPASRAPIAASDVPSSQVGVTTGGMKDIGLARKMIAEGEVPYASTFTVEGLVSEHDIPLGAAPTQRGLLYPTAAVGYALRYGQKDPEAILQIGFGAELPDGRFERPPLNLAIVVDCSGSMKGSKIAAAKSALRKILEQLTEQDRVALVCFDQSVWVPLVSSPMNSNTRADFRNAVDNCVGAFGATNIEGGLKAGLEQVAAHLSGARDNRQQTRVLLLTDAQPNVGTTGPHGFLTMMCGAAEHGIGVTAFGIGVDFGQDLAYRIMQVRGGSYHFLEDDAKLVRVFDEEFKYLVTPVAYDVELEVRPTSGSVVTDALGVPDFYRRESLRSDTVRLRIPTLFFSARSGGGATAVTLTLPSDYRPGEESLAEVSLSFRTTGRYEDDGNGKQYAQSLRMMLPSEVDLTAREPYFSHEGVCKTLTLADLVGAMKAATQGVMVLEQRQAYWHRDAAARNVWLGILPKLPTSKVVLSVRVAAQPTRITPQQAKAGYEGLHAFLRDFSSRASGIAGLDPELKLAEKLARLLKSKMSPREDEAGFHAFTGSPTARGR